MVDNSCGYNGTTIGFPWMTRMRERIQRMITIPRKVAVSEIEFSSNLESGRHAAITLRCSTNDPLLFNLIFPFLFLWDYVPGDSVRKIQPRFLFYPLPRGPIGGFTFEKVHSKVQFLIFFLSKNKDRYPERLPTSNIDNVWVTSSVSILPGRCWLQTIKWNRLLNKFSNKSQ